eukprot:TRINITY_DN1350_c0_g4_i1.p1 TRINITY_DN1350_c0_g4~~TRINITY_DN1350_c0_g4_i1.p1  ORF type:complete len:1506 (-),score=394.08 TRINITY_DN1350_c0_g4_i1:40-4557(-)
MTSLGIASLSNYEKFLKYRRPDDFKYQTDYQKSVWANTGQDQYVFGQIQKEAGDEYTLLLASGEQKNFKKNKCYFMNPPKFDGVEDCSQLTQLHEPAVLYNIRVRYDVDLMHTYSGLFLVILNPYKWIPIYTPEMVEFYIGKRRDDVAPHVFAMADTAYRTMLDSKRNQSMLITGESGAGKTENTKKVIQYLAQIAGRGGTEGKLEKKLLQANPLLEALGNAKTTKNNNSSRFGKFIKITFDKAGFISGASIVSYLLEKSRVVHQGKDERNFHIFYQMMAGMTNEEKRKYHLTVPEDFTFLNHSGCTSVRYIDDKKEWEHTRTALNILGFSEEDQHILFSVCSAILHLGNLPFVKESKSSDNAILSDNTALEYTAELLQVDTARLGDSIIRPKIKVGGNKEIVQKALDVTKASASRDALVKALYGRMFLWVVDKINKTLTVEMRDTFIGILDIAGFEIFIHNSFEQLCINYTNEKLQQFFNHHMFTLEQEEYQREKIEWKWVDFGVDGQATIDLLEKKPSGIFPTLDEESVFPNATDQTFVNKLDKAHKGRHPRYFKDALGKAHCFRIRHYAGEVEYDTTGWLEKNRDPLETDLELTINSTRSKLISHFFTEFALNKSASELASATTSRTTQTTKKGAQFTTVGGAHKDQLAELMATLEATYPHFIRCILPNREQVSGKIDDDIVLMQLRCNGVLEGIRIQRQGYPNRMVYQSFLKRYYLIAPNVPRLANDAKAASQSIIEYLVSQNVVDKTQVQYGLTKIFFRVGELAKIEEARERKIAGLLGAIQDASRGYVCRKLYKKTRERAIASRVLQRNIRAWIELKNWHWFLLYTKARQIAIRRNVEKEIEDRNAKIKELEGRLDSLNKEKDQLTNDITNVKSKLEVSEQTLREEKFRALDLEQSKNELTDQNKNMKESIADLQSDIKTTEIELTKAHEREVSIDKDIKDLEDQYLELQQEKKKLEDVRLRQEEEIKELNSALGSERDVVADMRRQKTKLEEQIEEINLNLDVELSTKEQLTKLKKQLENDIEDLTIKVEEEQEKGEKLVKDLRSVQAEIKERETEKATVLSDLSKVNDTNKQLTLEVADLKDSVEKESKARSAIERAKKKLEEEVEALNDDIKNSEKKSADLNKKIKKTEEELDETKFQLDEAKTQIEALQGRSALSGEEVKNLQDELEQTRSKLKKLEQARAGLEADISDIKDQLESEQRKVLNLEKDKKTKEEDIARLNEEVEEEKRKNGNLTRNQGKLESRISELTAKFDEQSTEKRDLEAKVRKLESQITDIELDIQAQRKQRDRLDQGRRELDNKLLHLETQLDEADKAKLSAEKAKTNIDDLAAELKHQIEKIQSETTQLDDDKKALEDDIQAYIAKIDSFDSERAELKKDQHADLGRIKNLQSAVESAENKAASYLLNNKKFLSEIDELRGRISDASRDITKSEKMKKDAETDLVDVREALDITGQLLVKTSEALRVSSKEYTKLREVNEELNDKLIQMAKKMKHQTSAI